MPNIENTWNQMKEQIKTRAPYDEFKLQFGDVKDPSTFSQYINRKRDLVRTLTAQSPNAILLVGKTGPIHQILVKQDDNKYVIKYEGNKFSGGVTYSITTGRLSRNPQPLEKIINKIVDANFSGYIIPSPKILTGVVNGQIDAEELEEV